MKRFIRAFSSMALVPVLAAVCTLAPISAHAWDNTQDQAPEGPVYTCQLAGRISGASVGVIIGGQYITGPGVLSCQAATGGEVVRIPVRLKLIGFGWGLDLTVVRNVTVRTAGIGVYGSPEAFIQTYGLGATAGATLIDQGIDFDAAVKVSGHGGLSFELGLGGRDAIGLGARLHAMAFAVERMN